MKRRDGRSGEQIAQPAVPLHRGVAVILDWGPPLAGHLEDLFTLEGSDGRVLHVRSRINVEGRTNETLQVGHRSLRHTEGYTSTLQCQLTPLSMRLFGGIGVHHIASLVS